MDATAQPGRVSGSFVIGSLVVGAVFGLGLVAVGAIAVGAVQRRREWGVATGPIDATGPEGQLQEPQYADRGTTTDGGDDAGDTVNAVVGTGITPFTNRAPLSVPRSEHSRRHG